MSHLVLELRPGEMMVVNGATLRFRSKCRVELISHARFLFGKQVMADDEAATSIRLLYLRLQTAYVGRAEERAGATEEVRRLLARLRGEADPDTDVKFAEIEQAFRAEDFYKALKVLRTMFQAEKGEDRSDRPAS